MRAPPTGPVLRDIHLPADPGWWPPAPGWWVLAGVVLGVAGWLGWRRWRGRVARRRLRQADAELSALRAAHAVDGDTSALAAGVSQLLRRVARLGDISAGVARGAQWKAVLSHGSPDPATVDVLARVDEAIYQPRSDLDAEAVVNAARAWLRHVLLRGPGHD